MKFKMRYLIWGIVILITYNLNAQETALYNSNGRLKLMPDLKVDPSRLDDMKRIEEEYFPSFYNYLDVPKEYLSRGISGLLIVKLSVSFNEKKVIGQIEMSLLSKDSVWIFKAVEETKDKLLRMQCMSSKDDLVFYIPILFNYEKDEMEKMLMANKAIVFKGMTGKSCTMLTVH